MNGCTIPKATLGRLPGYLQYLRGLAETKRKNISATAIAKGLALGDVQVRKDLAAVSGADCIVAIGGGSSMDTAKAIGIIIENPESAFADACCPGNPRETSVEEIKELYLKLM